MEFISLTIIWAVLILVFVIVEGISLGLTSIWFAFGALVALISTFFVNSLLVQTTLFLLTSVILLYFTKPIAKKYLKSGNEKTNVDSLIGLRGIVVDEISKHSDGQVKVKGQIWTAFSDEDINLDEDVIVEEVRGVKMKVKKEEK